MTGIKEVLLRNLFSVEKRFLLATFLMYGSGYYLLNPTILFFVPEIGAQGQMGLATSSFFVGVVMAWPVSSYLLNRFGSWRISWSVPCLTVMVVISYNLVTSLAELIAVQTIRGLLFGVFAATADSMLTTLVEGREVKERMKAFGRMYSTSTLSMLILSSQGVGLAEQHNFSGLWSVGAMLAACAVVCFLSIRLSETNKRNRKIVYKASLPYGVVAMGVTCYCGVVFQYVAKFAAEQESLVGIGRYFIAVMAFSVLFFRITVLGKFPEYPLVFVSTILLAVSGLLLAFGTGMIPFFLAAILVGVGYGVCIPACASLAYAKVPEELRGAAAGTHNAFCYGGPLLGVMTAGFLSEIGGYRNMFLVITVSSLLVSLVKWGTMKRRVAVDLA